jgi:Xaa-Pro aminopeptidase
MTGENGSTTSTEAASALRSMATAGRLNRLREGFDAAQLDALVVTHLTNIRYLTGFTGSAGILVVRPDRCVLVTDGRYGDQAAAQIGDASVTAKVVVENMDQAREVVAAVGRAGRVGLEAEHLSWAAATGYVERHFAEAEVVATKGQVEALRLVKDPGEVDRIRSAARIADAALAEVRPMLAEHPTERQFGLALDTAMRRLGASDVSFETIVASGPNGARPHHRPSDRVIVDGDLVVLDFGALVDGYHSDMTRTIGVGALSARQERMLEVVLASQAAGVAAVRAGVGAAEVDRVCREVIAEAGWEDAFTHGTGHGVGLDIHEAPRVGRTSDATLAPGHVVTVEPGVYLHPDGGVRIEDTLVVEADGATALTGTSKSTTI